MLDLVGGVSALICNMDDAESSKTGKAMVLRMAQDSLHLLVALSHTVPCIAVSLSDGAAVNTMTMSLRFKTINYFLTDLQVL